MSEPQRRLAALLAADIVGFSRLTELDETGTLALQRAHMAELIRPTIAETHGRIVKTTGDGLIAEFASVVDAVRAAVTVQRNMKTRESEVPDDRRIVYRFAVHVGDVEVDGDDLLGDAVNIVARLEGVAPPGGLVLSAAAHDQLGSNSDESFVDEGEIALHNISRPVHLWRWAEVAAPLGASTQSDNPSIAVLPFDNFGRDDQDWFADGMVEDVITALAQQPGLDVIARNTTFTYRGRAVDIPTVARELKVRYVVEGSARRHADHLRVTAQLIEAASGVHIWAERYDRKVEDVFDVQDDLTEAISAAIVDPIVRKERVRAVALGSRNLTVRDLFWQAWDGFCRQTPDSFEEARVLAKRGLLVAPNEPYLHATLALVDLIATLFGWQPDPPAAILLARSHADQAMGAAPDNNYAQAAASLAYILTGDYERGRHTAEQACDMFPGLATIHFFKGNAYLLGGYGLEIALDEMDRAIRLSPRDIWGFFFQSNRALTLYLMGRNDEAIVGWQSAQSLNPDMVFSHFNLAGVFARLGRMDESRVALDHALKLNPTPDLAFFKFGWPFRDPSDLEYVLEGMQMAGIDVHQ